MGGDSKCSANTRAWQTRHGFIDTMRSFGTTCSTCSKTHSECPAAFVAGGVGGGAGAALLGAGGGGKSGIQRARGGAAGPCRRAGFLTGRPEDTSVVLAL